MEYFQVELPVSPDDEKQEDLVDAVTSFFIEHMHPQWSKISVMYAISQASVIHGYHHAGQPHKIAAALLLTNTSLVCNNPADNNLIWATLLTVAKRERGNEIGSNLLKEVKSKYPDSTRFAFITSDIDFLDRILGILQPSLSTDEKNLKVKKLHRLAFPPKNSDLLKKNLASTKTTKLNRIGKDVIANWQTMFTSHGDTRGWAIDWTSPKSYSFLQNKYVNAVWSGDSDEGGVLFKHAAVFLNVSDTVSILLFYAGKSTRGLLKFLREAFAANGYRQIVFGCVHPLLDSDEVKESSDVHDSYYLFGDCFSLSVPA